ncbi:MAG: chemotaxis protein CheW [Bacillota bacterium]|nr:chemotaxis protein CheW [Bacillota bacterium]
MAEEIQLVVFKLKTAETVCEYGVPITKVQEIIPMATPTKLPQVPDFVEGIINLRDRIIPIIDIKKRFGMSASAVTGESRSVVVEVEGQTVGIIVDEVSEVLRLSTDNIESPPAVIGGIAADYLTGVGKVEERLLILLDMDKILTEGEKTELALVGE